MGRNGIGQKDAAGYQTFNHDPGQREYRPSDRGLYAALGHLQECRPI